MAPQLCLVSYIWRGEFVLLILFAKQRKDCCKFSCPGTSPFQNVHPFMSHLVSDFNRARYASTKTHYSVLRNVLSISFLRVAVVCAGSKHVLSTSQCNLLTQLWRKIQSNEPPRRSKEISVLFARYLLCNSLQNREYTSNKKDANGSLWLLILSNQTQSVYSSSTLVDSSLRCWFLPI